MEQKSFVKRTIVPVLLAIVLVTAIQLMPRQFPSSALPASMEGYACQVSLLEDGASTRTVTLTPEAAEDLYQEFRSARVQSRGPAEDATQRSPLLYHLIFTPTAEEKIYELFLDPEGRLFTAGKLYKLQGAAPQELSEELAHLLANSGQPALS